MAESASIRFNNPGAMWDGKIATRWGSKHSVILADGQKNHIAIFPTMLQGAAAQFDLWRSNYTGMTLKAAVTKWSGGNSSPAYIKFLKDAGVPANTPITSAFLSGPKGIVLMKAQAQWEAGKAYPISNDDWAKAQGMVFKTSPVSAGMATSALAIAGVSTATITAPSYMTWIHNHWGITLAGVIFAGIAIDLIINFVRNR